MKIIKYLAMGVLVTLSLASCDKDTEGLTDITYYPDLVMEGDEFMILPVGNAYVDPGCKGTLYDPVNDVYTDVSDKIIVEGADEIDPNTMGFYYVTYKAAGSDGYLSSVTRTVCVCDPSVTLDLSGTYNTDMTETKYGANKNPFSAYAASYGNTDQCTGITFTKLAPGFFYVNDLFAGWYNQIRGYAARYCMTGYISLDNDGNIELIDSYVSGWGDGLDYIEGGYYDAENGVISYSLSYASVIFMDVVLNKVD